MAADAHRAKHEVLRFAAEHRLVLETQIAALLGASERDAQATVYALVDAGHLTRHQLFTERPAYCQIRRSGLLAVGSELPPPRLRLDQYRHDVGAAWLWLAAHRGTFGPVAEILGERRLRSQDRAAGRSRQPYGVRLGGLDLEGNDRLHYPDLLLIDRAGHRLALELELTRKGQMRRDGILDAYGADARIDAVLYLAEANRTGRAIARTVEASVIRAGLQSLVAVQLVEPIEGAGEPEVSGAARRLSRVARVRQGAEAASAAPAQQPTAGRAQQPTAGRAPLPTATQAPRHPPPPQREAAAR